MKISVIGMGYVGLTIMAALGEDRQHQVVGVENNLRKLDDLTHGRWPAMEQAVTDVLTEHRARLQFTSDTAYAVRHSDISLICVGTPEAANGSLDMSHVLEALRAVGAGLRVRRGSHVVVVKSTVVPGFMAWEAKTTLERASGLTVGEDVALVFSPEFLREGSALRDFYHPPYTVYGMVGGDTAENRCALRALNGAFRWVAGDVHVVDVGEAEMLKLVSNTWHALKVVFANEVGLLARGLGVDSLRLMHLMTQDKTLNVSAAYLRPGFAYGGSCLPKDVQALTHLADFLEIAAPVVKAIAASNEDLIDRVVLAVERLPEAEVRTVHVVGLEHKPGTGDLRHSPALALVEVLRRDLGVEVAGYHPDTPSAFTADVVVLANRADVQAQVQAMRPTQVVIDAANTLEDGQWPCRVIRLT